MHAPPAASADLPQSMGSHHLFFALLPDEATRIAIAAAAARLRTSAHGGRWTAAHRYHITLQFLGTYPQLPDALVQPVCAAAGEVRAPGFSITLDRIGSFRTRSHLWWLGCQGAEPLLRLRAALSRSLEKQGVSAASGPFVPHVTLVRGAGGGPPRDAGVDPIAWPVTGFALLHSDSGARQPYRVVGAWSLPMG